jgi:hypothetical protein
MKTHVALLALVLCGLAACGSADATADESVKETVTVPAGARVRVALLDGISTTKNSPGDTFEASLVEPVVVDGKTVFEKGAKVKGRISDAEESGRVKGRASLTLVLRSIVREGEEVPIETKPFAVEAESTTKRDAAIIGGGAGVGAAVGAIAGGGKGAGIGALIGGGAGTGTVLATKGKEIHYPPETKLNFTLAGPVSVQ